MLRLFATCLLLALPFTAAAQDRRPSHCIAIADAAPGLEYIQKAAYGTPLPDEFTTRIHFIDHAMFLIETHGGLRLVTDYSGFIGATPMIPDVVTMNRAHTTHFTDFPDPAIPHVLRGWSKTRGMPADHHLDLGEVLVRSVSTDIRNRFDNGRIENGNSVFVFEVGGLCIGHLGHLHHEPNAAQYAAIGRLDVVMAPIDGGFTVPLETMTAIVARLRSSLVIPMHWFSLSSLDRFLEGMAAEGFVIERDGAHSMEVSLRNLPSQPTVRVLMPQWLNAPTND